MTYTYDLNGNQTGDGASSQTWDDEDRLVTWSGGGKSDRYYYNGLGLRVDKEESTTGSHSLLMDGSSPASPVLYDNNVSTVFTPGLSESQNGSHAYYHADTIGSTRLMTDVSQDTTASLLFDGFGESVSVGGTTPTEAQYAGAEGYRTDGDSGLVLCGNRYYNPATGRFLSQDPARSGSNWYAYAGNNPLIYADPAGLQLAYGSNGSFAGNPGAQMGGFSTETASGYWQRTMTWTQTPGVSWGHATYTWVPTLGFQGTPDSELDAAIERGIISAGSSIVGFLKTHHPIVSAGVGASISPITHNYTGGAGGAVDIFNGEHEAFYSIGHYQGLQIGGSAGPFVGLGFGSISSFNEYSNGAHAALGDGVVGGVAFDWNDSYGGLSVSGGLGWEGGASSGFVNGEGGPIGGSYTTPIHF